MPETALTSALNASIITFNGNEGVLQNDMGNTLIRDSITGGVMSLNDGFVPLGMKEHGGILYIASYNPNTKKGELGSIPSPIIHYNNLGFKEDSETNVKVSDLDDESEILLPKLNNGIIYITDKIFHVGDKFIVSLNLDGISLTYIRKIYNAEKNKSRLQLGSLPSYKSETYPIISKINKKGWYNIKLYAITDSGSEIILDNIVNTPQEYYIDNNNSEEKLNSEYWFIDATSGDIINEEKTRLSNYFRTYPNIPSGRLAIKFEPELHSNLQYLYNSTYGANYPVTYVKRNEENSIWISIPGFSYKADGAILPDKISVTCNNGNFLLYYLTIDNKEILGTPISGTFEITHDSLKFQQTGFAGVFKDSTNNYIISRKLPKKGNYYTEQELLFKNNNLDSLSDNLFAIKVSNLNTDINISINLYVKDLDGKYVWYRTDTLPKFNPAILLLNEATVVPENALMYYEFGHNDDETYDIKLFNNTVGQKCFIYEDEDGKILTYDDLNKKYKAKDEDGENQHTINNYKWMRTYIYPLYVVNTSKLGKAKTSLDDISLIWSELKDSIDLNFFIKTSARPQVSGWNSRYPAESGGITRSLLLPIATYQDLPHGYNRNRILQCSNKLRKHFKNVTNTQGYTADLLKNNSIYSVNLNAVRYGLFTSSFFSDPRNYIMGKFKSTGLDTNNGVETFWKRKGSEFSYDEVQFYDDPLACFAVFLDAEWLDLNISDTPNHLRQGLTYKTEHPDFPTYFPKDTSAFGLTPPFPVDKTDYFSICTRREEQRFNSGEIPYYGPYISAQDRPGFIDTALSLCPGYFTQTKPFSLNLNVFNYKYNFKYLYSNDLYFLLINYGAPYIRALVKKLNFQNTFSDIGDLIITQNFGENELNDTLVYQFGPNSYYKSASPTNNKLILNSTQSVPEIECNISPKSKTESFLFKAEYHSNATDTDKIIFVAAPRIFIKKGSGLEKKYTSDYLITKLLTISNCGFYESSNTYTICSTNVDKVNLLYNAIDDHDETLNKITLTLGLIKKTPELIKIITPNRAASMVNAPRFMTNSFCNDLGYLLIERKNNPQERFTIFTTELELEAGYYVFAINYNYSVNNPKFYLNLTSGDKIYDDVFKDKYFIAFYNKEKKSYQIKLDYSSNTEINTSYIKNVGLYSINELADQYLDSEHILDRNANNFDSGITFLDEKLYSGIIFEGVFCYKEETVTENGIIKKLGCFDKEFSGFQALPCHAYQRCAGIYRLGENELAIVDETSLDRCDMSLALQIISNVTIKTEVS